MTYEAAVAELYQAPQESFVAERKRLAAALKATDKEGAARLAKLPRPTISAWTVNQLWWHARDAFDDMLKTAAKLRHGDMRASSEHREAIAKLRDRASAILEQAGHAASEPVLRRITQTLAALAAGGGFDPDPPGALAADRDPPGFEALGAGYTPTHAPERPKPKPKAKHDDHAEERERELREERERKQREEEERARLKAERHRLETALRHARAEADRREREVKRLEKELADAQDAADESRKVVHELEKKLDN